MHHVSRLLAAALAFAPVAAIAADPPAPITAESMWELARVAAPALSRDGRLVYYPDENHWILKRQNSLFWYGEVKDWLARFAPAGGR